MIEPSTMYASSAFRNGNMTSYFLHTMDNEEKKIVEQEEKEIKDTKQNTSFYLALGLGSIGLLGLIGAGNSDNNNQLKMTAICVPLFAAMGYAMGNGGDYLVERKIYIERCDRLEGKIRNISKKISNMGENQDSLETEELEKARTFFGNRVMAFKSKFGYKQELIQINTIYKK